MIKISTKKVSFENRGDKIEVKLMNANWEVYYKRQVGLNDRKAVKELLSDLRKFGIELHKFPESSWFD